MNERIAVAHGTRAPPRDSLRRPALIIASSSAVLTSNTARLSGSSGSSPRARPAGTLAQPASDAWRAQHRCTSSAAACAAKGSPRRARGARRTRHRRRWRERVVKRAHRGCDYCIRAAAASEASRRMRDAGIRHAGSALPVSRWPCSVASMRSPRRSLVRRFRTRSRAGRSTASRRHHPEAAARRRAGPCTQTSRRSASRITAGRVQVCSACADPPTRRSAVVERLIADHPGRDLELCVTADARGPNPKVANLIGMQPRIRHDIVVLADSDIAVPRDYLARIGRGARCDPASASSLACIAATSAAVSWARLAAMAIDYHFLPNVLVGLALGLARPCFGSTIALRRETLARDRRLRRVRRQPRRRQCDRRSRAPRRPAVAVPPLVVAAHLRRAHARANCCATNCAGRARSARRARGATPGSC